MTHAQNADGAVGASALSPVLTVERGAAFDHDYVDGQIEYQQGNAALFANEIRKGRHPDLNAFANQSLPKIEDRLQPWLSMSSASTAAPSGEQLAGPG
ncbi:MAG: putative rane protein [Rhodospirillales bacterium]|jgi:predicted outer membrane protein|nr:putative rane protein [Rhodospirillales bacterium]